MKKSYVLSVIVGVALLLVSATVNPVYAGVIQRNATGALTSKEQIGTAASTDGTTITYKDKDGYVVGQEPDKNNWLGADGVAKMPSYSDLKAIYSYDIGNNRKESMLYDSEPRVGNIEYPEVNPATGRPLWETQPFWREDGSFDLYGYVRQFIPRHEKFKMNVLAHKSISENGIGKAITELYLFHAHEGEFREHPYENFSSLDLYIHLVGSDFFNPLPGQDISYEYFPSISLSDASLENKVIVERDAYISKADLNTPVARVTGTQDSYIYELEIRQLEEIMRDYIEDPLGVNIRKHLDTPTGGTCIVYGRDTNILVYSEMK